MKTLKKLALLPLFCGLLVTSACGNDDNDNNNEQNRLPSKIYATWDGEYGSGTDRDLFFYDNQNRVIRFGWHDCWEENGESGSSESFAVVNYNNGTITSIVFETNEYSRTHTFTHSGNTITRIRIEEENGSIWRDTSRFEVNNRGQITRRWGSDWESVFTYNANGNLIRIVDTETWSGGMDQWVANIEYSSTIRAVFRNSTTPEWFFQLYSDLLWLPSKHGFMPVRIFPDEGNWHEIITYTVDNGWVQTMTRREESIGSHPAVASMMRTSENFRANSNRLRSDNRPRQDAPRRIAPKSNGDNDYSERTLHFEYVNAR